MRLIKTKIASYLLASLLSIAISTPQAFAQDAPARVTTVDQAQGGAIGDDAKVAIAKQLANPIASLVSVPFQYNYSRGVGANQAGSEQTLLFQPVIPFDLGGGDAFILRPIVANAREVNVDGFSAYGVANVTIESFYAPNTGSSWIWGVGPYAVSPSGNSGHFGSQQTGAGVTGVVLNRQGPWTYGLLAYQAWSVGGNATFGTQNNLYGQPFVAYTNKHAWTFSLEAQAQYNYDAHRTTNPLFVGVSKLEVFDKLPVQFSVGPTYYISNAPGGPSGWGGRGTITFVFPK